MPGCIVDLVSFGLTIGNKVEFLTQILQKIA